MFPIFTLFCKSMTVSCDTMPTIVCFIDLNNISRIFMIANIYEILPNMKYIYCHNWECMKLLKSFEDNMLLFSKYFGTVCHLRYFSPSLHRFFWLHILDNKKFAIIVFRSSQLSYLLFFQISLFFYLRLLTSAFLSIVIMYCFWNALLFDK